MKQSHFDTSPRRQSDPRVVVVYVLFASLVCGAFYSLIMTIVMRQP